MGCLFSDGVRCTAEQRFEQPKELFMCIIRTRATIRACGRAHDHAVCTYHDRGNPSGGGLSLSCCANVYLFAPTYLTAEGQEQQQCLAELQYVTAVVAVIVVTSCTSRSRATLPKVGRCGAVAIGLLSLLHTAVRVSCSSLSFHTHTHNIRTPVATSHHPKLLSACFPHHRHRPLYAVKYIPGIYIVESGQEPPSSGRKTHSLVRRYYT